MTCSQVVKRHVSFRNEFHKFFYPLRLGYAKDNYSVGLTKLEMLIQREKKMPTGFISDDDNKEND